MPRGTITLDAPLARSTWFKTGGPADVLFAPADADDLGQFLAALPDWVPIMTLGLGSNLVVRDGGVEGVVVQLGKQFASIVQTDATTLRLGGATSGIRAASHARDAGLAGLEFLRGIPGTVGGFIRMNGGAYGRETADILRECAVMLRNGRQQVISAEAMQFSYRHSALPGDAIVLSGVFTGTPGDPQAIGARMDEIARQREESQPLRTRTGGSTFKNPPGQKAWALIDAAGCRGLAVGAAQVSEKHTNFLVNTGGATSRDIEMLGEEVRRRVHAHSGILLEWEIARIGRFAGDPVEPAA
ncbi:UDP-N-acetylmuramate dehydrogenase [Croceicoccus sp. F390]|uniref:UDP-N-acetylenolpyruvoylglucosamine reductase n=1 Tax=Croceicoccus esteveae TaxID=3075597 RepID=A0ABU2ZGD6_9SPHN|nr:UDP-N-acetylmuramate dehydrogenase [Croceicoccus sp. F390]MDT0575650.1 UDP-N-acetylmuramate dehydrogenase [Croceicoccus sp. F390]